MPNEGSQAAAPCPSRPTIHLGFLDGLRGLAALYVVLHHAYLEVVPPGQTGGLHPPVRAAMAWLDHGYFAVSVFIVLSGYCLMIPVVRSSAARGHGLVTYMKRRARRILPPYYAALALSLLLIAVVPGLQRSSGVRMDEALPAYGAGPLLSHLCLVHNLSPNWLYKIDPPMWSVAVEWQIYFLFPVVLVPVWRRWGIAALLTVAAGLAAATKVPRLVPAGLAFSWPSPWYILLFGLGMAAAAVSFGPAGPPTNRPFTSWGRWAFLLSLAFVACLLTRGRYWHGHPSIPDLVLGAATGCLLVFLTEAHRAADRQRPVVLRVLASAGPVRLGALSYSLYLVHFPLLSLCHLGLLPWGCPAEVRLCLLLGIAVPGSILFAYLFYLAFERPFTLARTTTARGTLDAVSSGQPVQFEAA
jgi:peptidoglycan/LPS O-acetylase OafA/YrhL